MGKQGRAQGVPTLVGEVIKRSVDPGVVPTFDDSIEVKKVRVQPVAVPAPPVGEVIKRKVKAPAASFAHKSDVKVHRHHQ